MTGDYYAGRDLGLPETGPGSVGPLRRRAVSGVVDTSVAVGLSFVAPDIWYLWPLLLLAAFVVPAWWSGHTLGLTLTGLRLVAVDEDRALTEQRGLTLLTAVGRTGLFWCSGLTFLIWAVSLDRDRRSWHDRTCRTVILATR